MHTLFPMKTKILKLIKPLKTKNFELILLICLGGITCLLWVLWDLDDKRFFISYFKDLKLWLWLALHCRLIGGVLILFVSIFNYLIRSKLTMIITYSILFFGVLMILGSDFLAIPGLRQYGRSIDYNIVIADYKIKWLIIGMIEFILIILTWILMYIKRSNSKN
jgi:hypothetical protein